MSARIPTACLALAGLLGLLRGGPTASAKPPDLPADQEVLCAPETAPPAETTPAPAGVDVQAAAAWCQALRTAERCLLCGAHPLLALVPDECLLAEEYEEAAAAWLAGPNTADDMDQGYSPPQGMPTEGLPPGLVRPAPRVVPPADRFTCPYLREQDAREHRTQACPLATPSDVVGNLHKLQEAQQLMKQGDYYRDSGHPESAALCYEKARRLCPGSRYEAAAAEQLRLLAGRPWLIRTEFDVAGLFDKGQDSELIQRIVTSVHPQSWGLMGGPGRITYDSRRRVLIVYQTPDVQEQVADLLAVLRRQAAEKATAEEEQSSPADTTDRPGEEEQSTPPADKGQIGPLLEACQRALHAGQYARAESLARRSLALDADAVFEHPLVYKEHLLTELAAKVGHPIVACPGAQDPVDQAAQFPCVAELLQRFAALYQQGLYAEAEQCALQGLAREPQNPALAAAAAEAAAQLRRKTSSDGAASCPSAEPPCAMRCPQLPPVDAGVPAAMDQVLTTAGEPAENQLQITVDESSGGAEEAEPAGDQGSAAPRSDWWRDLVDLVRSSACAEVEGKPLASRGCCRVPLGCMTGQVSWDNRGEHGSFSLTLLVFDAPAPNAGQRPQDEAKPAAPR